MYIIDIFFKSFFIFYSIFKMLLTMVFWKPKVLQSLKDLGGWLSRFTLIRLGVLVWRRSPPTAAPTMNRRRYGRALRIGWIPIYILPASGRRSHSLPR
jgi:hypothetical protein